MTQTLVLTDPARELAELCTALSTASTKRGEDFLSSHFKVSPWSREFFEIIFTISERCEMLKIIIGDLEIDADFREEMVRHVSAIMAAFSASAMRSQWKDNGFVQISDAHVNPLKAISGSVRQRVAYKKLSREEIEEISQDVATLREWLLEHQLEEQDFIRQALLEGLDRFLFRLERLQWLGWGYTLESLKEILSAYMLLERKGLAPKDNPNSAAVLKKVGTFLRSIHEKVGAAKDLADTGDWLIRLYAAGSVAYHSGPAIAGLLT